MGQRFDGRKAIGGAGGRLRGQTLGTSYLGRGATTYFLVESTASSLLVPFHYPSTVRCAVSASSRNSTHLQASFISVKVSLQPFEVKHRYHFRLMAESYTAQTSAAIVWLTTATTKPKKPVNYANTRRAVLACPHPFRRSPFEQSWFAAKSVPGACFSPLVSTSPDPAPSRLSSISFSLSPLF